MRGLKLDENEIQRLVAVSHPLRMRGLKPIICFPSCKPKESHPLRMRGLKHTGKISDFEFEGRILYGCVD